MSPEEPQKQQWQTEAGDPVTSIQRLETLQIDPSLPILAAGNPATSAHLLEQLARNQDARVRAMVASNPNTPWQLLESLAWEFPHEFLHNPTGPLYLMTHPEQVSIDE